MCEEADGFPYTSAARYNIRYCSSSMEGILERTEKHTYGRCLRQEPVSPWVALFQRNKSMALYIS